MSKHRYTGGIITATAPTPTQASASGVWTLDEAQYYQKAGNWPFGGGNDPYFQNNVLLLHGDGTNGAQNNTFLDGSVNNFTITRNGNPTQGSYSPYAGPGNWSFYFPGSSCGLGTPSNYTTGTADFTLECWFYATGSVSAYKPIIKGYSSSSATLEIRVSAAGTGVLNYYINTTAYVGNATIVPGRWYHVALCRSGGTIRAYLNGAQDITPTADLSNIGTLPFYIGTDQVQANFFTGYLSNIRFIKGTGIYSTTTITVPTTPLVATTQTSLLTANSRSFVNLSGAGSAFTVYGSTTVVSKFSPFTFYEIVNTNYSGYFDGTGDYISVTDIPPLELSGADFTIECWAFFNTSTQCTILSKRANNAASGPFTLLKDGSNVLRFYAATSTTSWDIINGVSFGTATLGQWNHISVCRAGGIFYGSLNGTVTSLGTSMSAIGDVSSNWLIGSESDTGSVNGSISNLRMVKGTARYTTDFTPPTAPLTATETASTSSSNYSYSLAMAGGGGDYLTLPASAAYNLSGSAGAWTIEGWIYQNSLKNATIISQGEAVWRVNVTAAGVLQFVFNTSSVMNFGTITARTWNHIAVVCDGTGGPTGVKAYLNGVLGSSGQLVPPNDSASILYVGNNPAALATWNFNGQISNLRLTRGLAVYTSAFTPPTAPLTDLTPTGNVSVSLNGTTDYLAAPAKTGGYLTAGSEFTVEGWVYLTGYPQASVGSYASAMVATAGSSNGWEFVISGSTGSNITGVSFSMKGVTIATYTGALNLNQWYHLAAVRSGTTLKVYVNGVAGATTGTLSSWTDNTTLYIGSNTAPSYPFYLNGFISNVRVVNGTAVYTANFTPPTSPLTAITGTQLLTCQTYGMTDQSTFNAAIYPVSNAKSSALNPFGTSTALLLGNNPIVADNSVNHATPTITGVPRETNTNPFVTQNAIDSYSFAFDGTGDYIGNASATPLQFGTGDFSVEFWFYPNAAFSGSVDTIFLETGTTANAFNMWWSWVDVGFFVTTGANTRIASTYKIGQWQHLAVCRQNGRTSTFFNGVRTASVNSSYNVNQAGVWIGGRSGGSVPFNGYIADLRVVKGSSAYPVGASGIPLPIAPLTPITNTSLLTAQNSTIVDNSGNNVPLTAFGDAKASAFNAYGGGTNLLTLQSTTFIDNSGSSRAMSATGNTTPKTASPFTDTVADPVAYNTTTYGGSIYFDGTGDYFNTPSSAALAFGSGNFTMEGYFYFISRAQSYPTIFQNSNSATLAANIWWFGYDRSDAAGAFRLYVGNVNTITQVFSIASPYSLYGRWAHIALVRYSNTYYLYVDGALIGSTASAPAIDSGVSEAFYVGAGGVGTPYGYFSNIRITKGTAIYTGPFVPSLAPMTTVSGTNLLLNGTNAGIFDNTMINDIETAGSAQVSTSVVKYGTGSISYPSLGSYLTFKGGVGTFNGATIAGSGILFTGNTFTVEAWINPITKVSTASYYSTIIADASATSGTLMYWTIGLSSTGAPIVAWYDGALKTCTGGSTIANNTWTHLAFVSTAGVLKIYVNGVSETLSGTTTLTTPSGSTGALVSGVERQQYWTGNLDDLRVTNGVARYTANFTPPQSAFPNF